MWRIVTISLAPQTNILYLNYLDKIKPKNSKIHLQNNQIQWESV